jgi:hypothetical protein
VVGDDVRSREPVAIVLPSTTAVSEKSAVEAVSAPATTSRTSGSDATSRWRRWRCARFAAGESPAVLLASMPTPSSPRFVVPPAALSADDPAC